MTPSKRSPIAVKVFIFTALVIIGLMAENKIKNTYVDVHATRIKEEVMARRVWKWRQTFVDDSVKLCEWLDSMKGQMDYGSFKVVVMPKTHKFWVLYRGTK